MKKYFVTMLTLSVVVMSFAGCGNEDTDRAAGEATKVLIENAVDEMEEMYKVAEVPENTESPESTEPPTEETADVGTNNPSTLIEVPVEETEAPVEVEPLESWLDNPDFKGVDSVIMQFDNTPIDYGYPVNNGSYDLGDGITLPTRYKISDETMLVVKAFKEKGLTGSLSYIPLDADAVMDWQNQLMIQVVYQIHSNNGYYFGWVENSEVKVGIYDAAHENDYPALVQ